MMALAIDHCNRFLARNVVLVRNMKLTCERTYSYVFNDVPLSVLFCYNIKCTKAFPLYNIKHFSYTVGI